MFGSRAKSEADLNMFRMNVTEAVNNAERCVHVKRLVTYGKLTEAFPKKEPELNNVRHKREEIERHNEVALRLAQQEEELELEQLQEEIRKRLAEAHLVELELQEDLSEVNDDFNETLSLLSGTSPTNVNQRINEWIKNLPAVTINNIQLEAVISIVLATLIATTTAVTSSLQSQGNTDSVTKETGYTYQAFTAIGVPTTVVPLTTAGPTAVAQALLYFTMRHSMSFTHTF